MSASHIEQEPYSVFSRWQIISIVSIASITGLLSPLSSTLYVPAIPAVATELHISIHDVNLTITTYLIFQGLAPMFWGAVCDSLGRRQLYFATLLVYIGACAGLAVTTSYPAILVLRALQAAGSASTTAIGSGLIGDLVPPDRRGGYIGNYSALAGLGTAVGPVLGGVFSEYTGWHGMFYFLAALAAFMLVAIFLFVPETLRSIVGNGSVRSSGYLRCRPPLPGLRPTRAQLTAADRRRRRPSTTLAPRKPLNVFQAFVLLVEPDVFCSVAFTGICFAIWQMGILAAASLYAAHYRLSSLSLGLTYLANGVGSLTGSILSGRLLNLDYRRQLRREHPSPGETSSSSSSSSSSSGSSREEEEEEEDEDKKEAASTDHLQVSEIEKSRTRSLAAPMVVYVTAVCGFGWAIQAHAHIAVPIILTFFMGGVSTMALATFSTLMVDVFTSSASSASASLNLARCLLAAVAAAVIEPLIQAVDAGWAFTISAAVLSVACIFAGLEWRLGRRWRENRGKKRKSRTSVLKKSRASL